MFLKIDSKPRLPEPFYVGSCIIWCYGQPPKNRPVAGHRINSKQTQIMKVMDKDDGCENWEDQMRIAQFSIHVK